MDRDRDVSAIGVQPDVARGPRHIAVWSRDFLLKQEFLAIMLGVHRTTVTLVMGTLQRSGLISSRYRRIRVLKKRALQAAACECHDVIRALFQRLGL
jgi:CRP-like cAMP-binding protein